MTKKTTQASTANNSYLQVVGFDYNISRKTYIDYEQNELVEKSILLLTLAISFIATDGETKKYARIHSILDTDCIGDLSLDLSLCQDKIKQDEFNKYNSYELYKTTQKYIDNLQLSEKRN